MSYCGLCDAYCGAASGCYYRASTAGYCSGSLAGYGPVAGCYNGLGVAGYYGTSNSDIINRKYNTNEIKDAELAGETAIDAVFYGSPVVILGIYGILYGNDLNKNNKKLYIKKKNYSCNNFRWITYG